MSNCADDVRVACPLFQEGRSGSTPTSALQLWFGETTRETFVDLNKLWHSRLPKIGASQGRVFYNAQHDGIIYAVAMWSNPVARLLPQLTWLELRRFAISGDAPKNTASRFLAWMTRDIAKRFPEVIRLISYQDCEVHLGTIYKAAGWNQAEGYKGRKRGWESTKGGGRQRVGRTNQAVAVRMRWEKVIRTEATR
jgi:hypothetical protein